jgi:two-component system, chemotaxis family, CheB/CheR fusion protein
MDSSLIVGIGASAGGIKALKDFLAAVPEDSGMAFVVILHLSPDHESRLAEVLRGATAMPVTQVTETVAVKPNHVYVVPPDQSLAMVDGHLALSPRVRSEQRRAPIDIFFRTLGETHHARAVGVVLSGTGADGSMGLKSIKENGGLCFAQDPNDADYSDMPRNSIATGIVDHILPARDIAAKIHSFLQHLGKVHVVHEPVEGGAADEHTLQDIFTQIRTRTGHDFANYKRPTMMRRITRRMAVNEVTELAGYAAMIRERPQELQALLKDLLISVTHFFRDPKAFDALSTRVIPHLFRGQGEDDQVRVWVPGCATGEEAYSIGILLLEHAAALPSPPAVQVFATDLDGASIALARQGLYTANDTADMSQERLRRFFTKEGEAYRVRQDLRESVLFSQHDILEDPPFSHLDLVSCRNLLIYLNRTAQRRVMEIVHFALSPGRYLFLGSSESMEASSDLFAPYAKDAHLFQSRALPDRIGLPVPRPKASPTPEDCAPPQSSAAARERILSADLHHHLLEQYAPPSVLVNADHEVLHLSATAGRYLELSGGDPSLNVLKVVRPELRLELRSALYQAAQQRTPVEARNLVVRLTEDRTIVVTVIVKPAYRPNQDGPPVFLVLFREEPDPTTDQSEPVPVKTDETAQRLDDEVVRLKAQLRAALERHDVQLEDHTSALEQQQAMYEALRSSSEELETSREELQSLNEELRTVNQELRIKIDEQTQAHDDIQNLVASTEIATIFLDRSLRIKFFTPSVRNLFGVSPADRGRPLSDIKTALAGGGETVHHDAERVLNNLERIERELSTRDGRWLMMRVHPYRTTDDRIDGVVLTFVDITDRKRAGDLVAASEERLQRAVDVENVAITFFTMDGRLTHANDAFLQMTGSTRDQLAQGALRRDSGTPPEWRPSVDAALEQLRRTGRAEPCEREYVQTNGTRRWLWCAATLLAPDQGVEFMVDITPAKQFEEQLRGSEARLRMMIESVTEYAIITMDAKGRIDHWNTGATRMFGYAEEEILGQSASLMFTPEDRAAGVDRQELRQARDEGRASDERWHLRKDGSRFYSSGVTAPILDAHGDLRGYVKVARDLTDRKRSEDALREAHAALEQRVQERTVELSTANQLLEQELRERTHSQARIRDLLGRVISIQEEERKRISRDLHDQVGQQIIALRLQLEALDEESIPEAATQLNVRSRIEAAMKAIATLDRDIDYFTWELRPAALDEFGLVAALRRFVVEWSKTFSISAAFHTGGLDGLRLTPIVETNLYRIVQEALNNIHKHSGATVVSVILERRGDEVVLVIDDDGCGFNRTADSGSDPRGIGLLGMQERASLAGGTLEVKSEPGEGTTVSVRVRSPAAETAR